MASAKSSVSNYPMLDEASPRLTFSRTYFVPGIRSNDRDNEKKLKDDDDNNNHNKRWKKRVGRVKNTVKKDKKKK